MTEQPEKRPRVVDYPIHTTSGLLHPHQMDSTAEGVRRHIDAYLPPEDDDPPEVA